MLHVLEDMSRSPRPEQQLEIAIDRSELFVACLDVLLIVIWRSEVATEVYFEFAELAKARREIVGRDLLLLTIVDGAKMTSPQGWSMSAEAGREIMQGVKATAAVLTYTGLIGWLLRVLIALMLFMFAIRFPVRGFSRIEPALDWLIPLAARDALDPARVELLVRPHVRPRGSEPSTPEPAAGPSRSLSSD